MPKYLIKREIPGACKMSSQDLQGASQKSCGQLNADENPTPDPPTIAGRFKRARTTDVEDILEALEVLGLVR